MYTFENLPKYAETGEEYLYTVEEILPTGTVGYSKEINSNDEGYVIENIFDTTKIDVTFTKVWENVNDNSLVPNIYIDLYQDGNKYTDESVMLKGGNIDNRELTYVFKDLPKYSTEGKEYVYTIEEKPIMGYEPEVTVDDNNITITNTFTPGKVKVSGTKTWNMVDEADLSSVPTITVRLQSSTDGIIWTDIEGKVVQLKAGELDFKFTDLPEYSVEGYKYKYRVVEDSVDGYKTSVDLNNNITNTYTPGETTIKVAKKWTNVDPNIDTVPEVKIILKQDGTEVDNIVLDKDNNYTHTFEDLDKYAPTGKEYVYTVEEVIEDDVEGYTNEITSGEDGFIVENIFDKDSVVDITFKKVCENVPGGSEVPSITLHLYQNGVELEDRIAILASGIKENGRENYIFKDLPKYSTDGTEYVYTIKEDSINGYTSSGEANASNEYTITNTYDGGGKVVINGTKTWINVENVNEVPDITIRVLRDGEEIHNIVVPSGTTEYKVALDSMVKYDPDWHEYVYELKEDKIEGFEAERDGYNFTNTKIIEEGVSGISDINIGGSNTNINSNINTGDKSMILLYASLAIISLSLISIVALRKRRKTIEKL